ncbi:MAG: AMP-binding protein, partial [candidate division NC10 bacterium]
MAESAARYGDRPTIIYRSRGLTVSYRGLLTQAERVANSLAALGIVPGEHVAVWAPNIPEWICLQFGCALHGAVLVPVNTNYQVFELEHLLTQSDTVALFLVDGPRRGEYSAMLRDLCPELEHAGGRDLHLSRLPCLRRVVRLDGGHAAGMLGWEEFLAAGAAAACSPGVRDSTDIAMILYTSGTTGFPKGVMLSHANVIGNARSVGEAMRLTAEDRLCIPVPFFHCFGSVMGILLCAARGAAMVPLESFRPAEVLETVAACRCTALHGVPAMFIAEMEELRKGGYDTSSLRTGMMGGSPCPQEVMRAVTEQMGARELCIAYGLTETSPIITLTRPDAPLELRASTVGTPLPGVEVKIVHPRSGEPVPPAVQGELYCRGPNVMRGYYKLPEATAQA